MILSNILGFNFEIKLTDRFFLFALSTYSHKLYCTRNPQEVSNPLHQKDKEGMITSEVLMPRISRYRARVRLKLLEELEEIS